MTYVKVNLILSITVPRSFRLHKQKLAIELQQIFVMHDFVGVLISKTLYNEKIDIP